MVKHILLLCFLCYVCCERDIIALFTLTNCQPHTEYICQNANMNMQRILNNRYDFDHTRYCFINVNDSMDVTAELILRITENTKLDLVGDCFNHLEDTIFDMERIAILSYVSFDITRLISYLLLNSRIILIAVTFESMAPFQLVEKVNFVYSYETSFGSERQLKAIKRLMSDVGMNYIAVLYINEFEDDKHIIQKDCRERPNTAFCYYVSLDVKDHTSCFKELFIDHTDEARFTKAMGTILNYPHLRVLTIYSHMSVFRRLESYDIFYQWEHHKITNSPFYLVPFERILSNETVRSPKNVSNRNNFLVKDIPGEHALNEILEIVTLFEYTTVHGTHGRIVVIINNAPHDLKLLIKKFVPQYDVTKKFTLEMWLSINIEHRKFISKIMSSSPESSTILLKIWKKYNYLEERTVESILESKFFNPRIALESEPYCNLTIPTCGQGQELKHGLFKEENWTNSYGWYCKSCASGSFKQVIGNSECRPCVHPLVTDDAKISCYDPFSNHFIRWNGVIGNIVLVISVLCMIAIILTSAAFIKHRETPIVKHADRPMVLIQLTSHFFICLASILLFVGQPTRLKCLLRPILTGLLFTVTVSVNLAKTQKLQMIFNNSNRRLTHQEVKFIGILEWIVVLFSLLLDVSLLVVSMTSGEKIQVEYFYHEETLIKEIFCNNNTDLVIQLFFILILVLTNGIQAIRSRNLPSHFKETIHVIYSSFVSILLFSGVCAIYYTQHLFLVKEAILVFTLLALNALHFALIYCYKMFIMILRPSQNTLRAFNVKRAQKFNQKF